MDYCVICLSNKNTKDNKFVLNPSLDAFEKLLVRAGERHNYKDSELTEFVERTKSVTARVLFDQHAQYHVSCCKRITNTEKVQRAKKHYFDSVEKESLLLVRGKLEGHLWLLKIVNIMRV